MSNDLNINDTIHQRAQFYPTPIVMIGGVTTFPAGSIIDARYATLELNGQFLDQLTNENIVQGQSLTNPNTIGATTTRSVIVGDTNCSITGVTTDAIIASDTCSIGTGATRCDIIGSGASSITGTGSGTNVIDCGIENSTLCTMTNNNTGTIMLRNNITASTSTTLTQTAGAADTIDTFAALASANGTVSLGAASTGGVRRGAQVASFNSAQTVSGAGGISNDGIYSSDTCNHINTGPITTSEVVSIGSNVSPITNNGDGFMARVGQFCCSSVPITSSAGAGTIANVCSLAHANSTITNSSTGSIGPFASIASNNCSTSNSTTGSISNSGHFGSVNTNITSSTSSALNRGLSIGSSNGTISATGASAMNSGILLGSNLGSVTNSGQSVLTGAGPVVNGLSNVFCHSATATANSQAIFGTRLDITGAGNNLTVGSGYVNSASGYVEPYRSSGISTTLAATDGLVALTAVSTVVTIPTAAAMSASFPVGTTRKFRISNDGGNTGCAVTLSGGNLYRKKTGWSSHPLGQSNEVFNLVFVNDSVTPYWTPEDIIRYSTTGLMTTANNFGLTPPKSDASQLPTSTSAANHATLTTTSFVTFNSTTTTNSAAIAISGQGLIINFTGLFTMEYEIDILTSTGLGEYLIRADICTTAGVQLANSYAEVGGANTVGGTRTLKCKSVGNFVTPVGTIYTVRISQDSSNLINASASITSVRFIVQGQF